MEDAVICSVQFNRHFGTTLGRSSALHVYISKLQIFLGTDSGTNEMSIELRSCGVARRVHRPQSGALHAKLVPVFHRGEGEGAADLWVGCVAPGVFV